jgi:hypothetical protein
MSSLPASITAFLTSTGVKLVGKGHATFDNYTLIFARFTPTAAKAVLRDFNSHNRLRRDKCVLEYAKAIVEKEWQLNGAVLVFDPNGQMLDGQHRLEGVATAKKATIFPVIFGVPFEAFKSIDRGRLRKLKEDLQTLGYPWAADRAKLAKILYREMSGNLLVKTGSDPLNPSTDLGLDIAHHDVESREQITRALHFVYGYGAQWSPRKMLSRPLAAWCFIKLESIHRSGACEYMHRLITGEAPTGGASNGVANAVRNRLMELSADEKNVKDRLALRILTIMAGWNRFCSKGNDPVSKFDVPKLRNKRTGEPLITELFNLKKPNRKTMVSAQGWFVERYDLNGVLNSGQRRGEQVVQRAQDRMSAVDDRATRLHDRLVEAQEEDEE